MKELEPTKKQLEEAKKLSELGLHQDSEFVLVERLPRHPSAEDIWEGLKIIGPWLNRGSV